MKKLISERALLARINRALVGEIVKKCRADSKQWPSLGTHYSVDLTSNTIIHTHIDLEAYGRELGCLTEFESWDEGKVAEDELRGVLKQLASLLQEGYDAKTEKQKKTASAKKIRATLDKIQGV